MKAKVHKITVCVVDNECYEDHEIAGIVEGCKGVCLDVMEHESVEVDWHDDHPLNKFDSYEDEFNRLFNKVD